MKCFGQALCGAIRVDLHDFGISLAKTGISLLAQRSADRMMMVFRFLGASLGSGGKRIWAAAERLPHSTQASRRKALRLSGRERSDSGHSKMMQKS